MYQIDNATVAASQPPSTAQGATGYFTDGNPASNIPATIVPAEWLNSVMMELMNAVTGSGQTLNKAAFNQLWTAIQNASQNTGVTPPQFDNTTKTATTAFVQRALGNYQGARILSAPTVLNAADAGRSITLVAGSSATLPPYSSVPVGSAISFLNADSAAKTVTASGTDKLYLPVLGGGFTTSGTSLTMLAGDSVTFVATAAQWEFVQGTALLSNSSGVFGASMTATNGFQKLPSGLIIQWMAVSVSSASGVAITFPIAFPSASFTATAMDGGLTAYSYGISSGTTTGAVINARQGATAVTGAGFLILIGH
ncbi:gp53-like domain-containing protein [Paraburkholderia sp. 35.1]|uniref:gp53-like domain-containing protein n=1 Tax=Paraburkholderia sp. 35.1 TaxID=2991058 RepID=UPI003D190D4F